MPAESGRRCSWWVGLRSHCRTTTAARPATRVEIDADDIALLYREVGYRTVEGGLALVERSCRGRPIAAEVQFPLSEIVAALDEG